MSLNHCINYLLTTAQHEVFQDFVEGLSAFGITPGQYGVLSCLWRSETGWATPTEIAGTLKLETSTVSEKLDRMEKQGLIVRELIPDNHRSIRVCPTRQGLDMREGVLRTIDARNDAVLERFTPEEQDTLRTYLKRLGQTDEGR